MHVGILMPNSPQYIVSYYALLSIGATVIPLNPQYREKELAYILNNADASALIYHNLLDPIVQLAKPDLPSTKLFIEYNEENSDCTWNRLLNHEPIEALVERNPDDTAQILYTSGTTGLPKGAMITVDNVAWMTKIMVRELETVEEDRCLVVLPVFHALAKMAGLWGSFYVGATVYLEERFVPDAILEMIEREKITVFAGVPTMFTMFAHSPRLKDFDYSSLRSFGSGGASIPVEIIDRIRNEIGVEIAEAYGQTEATIMITAMPRDIEKVPGSVGRPVDGIDFRIVTPDNKDVPQGEVGEIIFRGRNMMKGYYKNPEATASTIIDGWVHTGDLARQDEHGNVFIVDRMKDMIIRGGYNVYPREIEELLYTHPAVVECAVIGEPHDVFGEEIVAYVVVKNDVTEEELSTFCKQNLANYKVPRIFRYLDALPKTATGKILKGPLKQNSAVKK
jgi:long-chain acyl-CoA synthetase